MTLTVSVALCVRRTDAGRATDIADRALATNIAWVVEDAGASVALPTNAARTPSVPASQDVPGTSSWTEPPLVSPLASTVSPRRSSIVPSTGVPAVSSVTVAVAPTPYVVDDGKPARVTVGPCGTTVVCAVVLVTGANNALTGDTRTLIRAPTSSWVTVYDGAFAAAIGVPSRSQA